MMYRIIPKHDDKKVIDPSTMKKVPMEGIVIPRVTTYWKKREQDKDITIENLSKKKVKKVIPKNNEGEK